MNPNITSILKKNVAIVFFLLLPTLAFAQTEESDDTVPAIEVVDDSSNVEAVDSISLDEEIVVDEELDSTDVVDEVDIEEDDADTLDVGANDITEEDNELALEEDSVAIVDSTKAFQFNGKSEQSKELQLFYYNEAYFKHRLDSLEQTVAMNYNDKVKGFINFLTVRNRNYLITMEKRRNIYFPLFEKILKEQGVPQEIKYLAIVESGLNPFAVSPVGAAGLWQFMPATGKEMGLIVNDEIDERLDPVRSTYAACRYLKILYRYFNDWELALASYNCGPGVVRRAMRRSGRKSFWTIYNYLPSETRSYVPMFVAVNYGMNNLAAHEMFADSIMYPMEFDTIRVTTTLNAKILCDSLNICLDDFQFLNPALRTNIIPEKANYLMRLPKDKLLDYYLKLPELVQCANQICDVEDVPTTRKIKKTGNTSSTKRTVHKKRIVHTVKRGESLGRLAQRYHVSVNSIKRWNRLKSSQIRIGQKLVIYKTIYTTTTSTSTTKLSSSRTSSVSKNNSVHVVSRGESLGLIAQKYGVTVSQLKQWNNLSSSIIKIGQRLVVNGARSSAQNTSSNNLSNNSNSALTKVEHVVTKGESLGYIAEKYRCYVDDLRKWNNLSNDNIKIGQKLILYTKDKYADGVNNYSNTHVVVAGESLGRIAAKYGVSVADLKKWNNLSNDNIKIGQKLEVKSSSSNTSSVQKTSSKTIIYVVKKGDSLYSIAKNYSNVSVEDLKKWNNIQGNEIKIGQELKIIQ